MKRAKGRKTGSYCMIVHLLYSISPENTSEKRIKGALKRKKSFETQRNLCAGGKGFSGAPENRGPAEGEKKKKKIKKKA